VGKKPAASAAGFLSFSVRQLVSNVHRAVLRPVQIILPFVSFLFFGCEHSQAQTSSAPDRFLSSINAPKIDTPGSATDPIVVAVVDDGVRISHRDLRQLIWSNPKELPGNRIDDDGNGYVDDIHGWDVSDDDASVTPPKNRLTEFYHGTHLAGIIMQVVRHVYGTASSAFIRIMPVKSLSDRAERPYMVDGYKGIEYAIGAGADIIVCAWGVGHISPEQSQILKDAHEKGILIVASAGNFAEGREQYPAAHDSVVAVASLDHQSRKMASSNYGAFVDLSAPGTEISSTSARSDTDYEEREGTSPSAAIVAGAAAVVKLQHPSYSVEQVSACLKQSSANIEELNSRYFARLGAGKLNVEGAVACDLFDEGVEEEHQLLNPRGYLRLKGTVPESAAWAIRPHGLFNGLRFNPRITEGSPGESTITFYKTHSGHPREIENHLLAELPDSVFVTGTTAYVTFKPKGVDKNFNWLLEYRAEPIDYSRLYCRGTVYLNEEGTFEDASGPNEYSFNSDCKWLITAPEGKVIHIRFTEFDTEARTDLVYFFNGAGTHEDIMAIFSGAEIPPELTTWHNRVLVWFITDGKVQGKGWKAEYRFQ